MKAYIVTYTVYYREDGDIYTEAVAFDNEADADRHFENRIIGDVMQGFEGTSEQFDRELERLKEEVMPHTGGLDGKMLQAESGECTYLVTLIRQTRWA